MKLFSISFCYRFLQSALLVLFANAPISLIAQPRALTVTTLAGRIPGGITLNFANGLAVDAAGNAFVANTGDNTIVEFTHDGQYRVVAGQGGKQGNSDGPGNLALFDQPTLATVDAFDNIFVLDVNNQAIRKIDAFGNVTTSANVVGEVNGLAVGSDNHVYFTANTIAGVYRLDSNGRSVPIAGGLTMAVATGTIPATMTLPKTIALGGDGALYAADTGLIRRVGTDGAVTTLTLTTGDGAPFTESVRAVFPDGLGNLLVQGGEFENKTWRVSLAGLVSTPAVLTNLEGAESGDFAGNIYVLGGDRLTIIHPDGSRSYPAPGTGSGFLDGSASGAAFNYPSQIACRSDGSIAISDTLNAAVRRVTAYASVTTLLGPSQVFVGRDGSSRNLIAPHGVAVDSGDNTFVVSGGAIVRIGTDGSIVEYAGNSNEYGFVDGTLDAARFFEPNGLALDAAGNLYVADGGNHAVRKITPAGIVTTVAGGTLGASDGTGSAAQFGNPFGLAIDLEGNLYVTDALSDDRFQAGNNAIRKITPAGVVTTIAGGAKPTLSNDGPIDQVALDNPRGIAVDSAGLIYFSEMRSSGIRVIDTKAGTITTVAGNYTQGDSDGTGVGASFNQPMGLVFDAEGALYVADTGNNAIRKAVFRDRGLAPARLTNLSARAYVGTGDQVLIAGFIVSGAGRKTLLLRGAGAALSQSSIASPRGSGSIALLNTQGALLQNNTSWDHAPLLTSAFNQAGTPPFASTSSDNAMVSSAAAAGYTLVMRADADANGIGLGEVYDMDSPALSRFTNLSVRAFAGSGQKTLIGGFIVEGQRTERVLIRALGKSLGHFGVSDFATSPTLTLFSGVTPIARSATGPIAPSIAAAAQMLGAPAITSPGDAALIADLSRGGYTVQVLTGGGQNGVVLLEIYELP